MNRIPDEFNKVADLLKETLRNDSKQLSKEGGDIYAEFLRAQEVKESGRKKAALENRDKETAKTATLLIAKDRVLTPFPSTRDSPVSEAEVKDFVARATRQGVEVEKLAPKTKREDHIRLAYGMVRQYERDQDKVHADQMHQDRRKLMDNLLDIDRGTPLRGPSKRPDRER